MQKNAAFYPAPMRIATLLRHFVATPHPPLRGTFPSRGRLWCAANPSVKLQFDVPWEWWQGRGVKNDKRIPKKEKLLFTIYVLYVNMYLVKIGYLANITRKYMDNLLFSRFLPHFDFVVFYQPLHFIEPLLV